MKKFSTAFKNISEFQIAANNALNWILQGKSSALNKEPSFVLDVFRSHLFNFYSFLPQGNPKKRIALKKFQVPKDKKYIPLIKMQREFKKNKRYFSDVVIHGSVADGTVIKNWADVDLLAIVKNTALEDSQSFLFLRDFLLEIEKNIFRFDQYQHHGIQFVTEKDLKFYPEVFLPLAVIKEGKSLIKNGKLVFNIRDSAEEQRGRLLGVLKLLRVSAKTGILKHHARGGVYLAENYKNKKDNFYQFKYFISVVLLLPGMFLEVVDKPIYKKYSFEKIKKYFSHKDLELVRACEETRKLFDQIKPKDNEIPEEVIGTLGRDYLKRGGKLARVINIRLNSKLKNQNTK